MATQEPDRFVENAQGGGGAPLMSGQGVIPR